MLKLELIAPSPAEASLLISVAQPLGAETIVLSVDVSGYLKDTGWANFKVEEVKPTHALKPLDIAQRICTAMKEEYTYEARLELGFGESGRMGLETQLQKGSEEAPENIKINAYFDKPHGGSS